MPADTLDNRQRRQLRTLAHALKPVVRIGQQGIGPGIFKELDRALSDHELVKIKLAGATRAARRAALDALACASGAEIVQHVGHTAVLFRRNPDEPQIRFTD